MEQFFKGRILSELFESAPILLAGLGLQFGAHRRQVQGPLGK